MTDTIKQLELVLGKKVKYSIQKINQYQIKILISDEKKISCRIGM